VLVCQEASGFSGRDAHEEEEGSEQEERVHGTSGLLGTWGD
jgi:hypothetical protein